MNSVSGWCRCGRPVYGDSPPRTDGRPLCPACAFGEALAAWMRLPWWRRAITSGGPVALHWHAAGLDTPYSAVRPHRVMRCRCGAAIVRPVGDPVWRDRDGRPLCPACAFGEALAAWMRLPWWRRLVTRRPRYGEYLGGGVW